MARSANVVRIIQGYLRGNIATTRAGKTYYSFQGIPYAKPPVGALRFKAPQPAQPWEDVHDALVEGAVAPHIGDFLSTDYVGEEDCLFLNVYTPRLPEVGNVAVKPVMVWIHGGAFYVGSGNSDFYAPDYLIAEDVVLVTINYRLGALGFLSTGDDVIPGNNGLKDQVMALRWVQQNIAQFGGDPNNVTIFGESAGAVSVNYHLFSPMSKGLFHRAIAQSGSIFNPWAFADNLEARSKAFRFGKALGIRTNDSNELLNFLMQLSTKDLVEGMYKALTYEEKHPLPLYFAPVNETTSESGKAFLTERFEDLLKQGKFQNVPFLTGVNSEEAMFVLNDVVKNPEWYHGLNKEFKLPICHGLGKVENDTNKYQEITKRVRKFYFGSQPLSKETWRQFANMYSDIWFNGPAVRSVKKLVKQSSSPIYFYRFAFDGALGFADIWAGEGRYPGVCHADEIGYLFQTITNKDKNLDPEDDNMKTISRIVKLWTNFAKTGNPTPEMDPLLGVMWEPVTKAEFKYLNIDKNLSMEVNFEEERIVFMEKLYHSLESSNDYN